MTNNIDVLISKILEINSKELGDIAAIVNHSDIISYLDLKNRVLKVVSLLEKQALSPNICVGLRFENNVNYIIFHLALLKMRITQTSINPQDILKIQLDIVNEIGVDLIIQDIPLHNALIQQSLFIDNDFDIRENRYIKQKKKKNSLKNACVVFLGSGTTNKPKIIALDTLAYYEQILRDTSTYNFIAGENYYTHSHLSYHTPKRRIISALYNGLTIYIPKTPPNDIISFCLSNNIHYLALTTDQARNMIFNHNHLKNISYPLLTKIKMFIISSSVVCESLKIDILNKVTKNLYIGYGTNELGEVTVTNYESLLKYNGTVGNPLSNIMLKIVDDNKKECLVNEVGNILIKSPKMINGYIDNAQASKKAFTDDGYYPGDLGRLTADGNLILEGRKDDMMILSGVNIYPRELESVLESHPNVIESAVFPLRVNNQDGVPFAVVVVNKQTSEQELLQWCYKELGWKQPQKIFFTQALPKNSGGKVLKRVLIEQVIQMLSHKKNNK